MLALPWDRFYTTSLFWHIGCGPKIDGSGWVRISHQSIKDLRFWKRMTGSEMDGRSMQPKPPTTAMHKYSADVGLGGTLHDRVIRPGIQGL